MVTKLTTIFDEEALTIVRQEYNLTPREAEIFFLIYETGDKGCCEFPAENSLRTHIFNLKQKLKKFNIEIFSVGNGGYKIPADSRERIGLRMIAKDSTWAVRIVTAEKETIAS